MDPNCEIVNIHAHSWDSRATTPLTEIAQHGSECPSSRGFNIPYACNTFVRRYQLLRKLGSGVAASVYLAWDTVLERYIALKAVPIEGDSAIVGREATTLAQLSHPHIVTIYEASIVGKYYVVSMEYLEGGTLAGLLRVRSSGFEIEEFAKFARQLLLAFACLHEQNIVHRDCKPSNIGFTKDGNLKLLDFGIAKRLGLNGATVTGTFKATAEYAPPEQLLGQRLDRRCDLFSVAVVLYEMLAGVHPFLSGLSEQPSPDVVLARLLFTTPAPLRTLRRDIPNPIEAAIMRNLSKERDRRSASAPSFLDALEGRSETPLRGRRLSATVSRLLDL